MNPPPKISVLLPTRKRVKKLDRAIESYLKALPGRIEVLLYVHDDDPETLSYAHAQLGRDSIFAIKGQPWLGGVLGPMHTILADYSQAPFVWMGNDDVVITGSLENWNPEPNTIYQPETHQLNISEYNRDQNCPFFIMPNGCWRQYGQAEIVDPVDVATLNLLRSNGWKTDFVPGLKVWHDRDEADCHRIATL